MSINVEVIGGTPMVQHYVEQVADRHHLVLDSVSDLFTQNRLCLLTQRAQNRWFDEYPGGGCIDAFRPTHASRKTYLLKG